MSRYAREGASVSRWLPSNVIVDAQGRPSFPQFAAKLDGKDYPGLSTESAAKYLSDGTAPPRTYADIPIGDPLKVKRVDEMGGKVLFSGEKWVSVGGKKSSFTVNTKNEQGADVQYPYVFDRTGLSPNGRSYWPELRVESARSTQ